VVRPEQVPRLIGEPPVGTPSTVLQVFQQRLARLWRGFWPRRFHDFNVFTEKKEKRKAAL
jgi:hypothetical protein